MVTSFAHSLLLLIAVVVVAASPVRSFSHDSHVVLSTLPTRTRAPWSTRNPTVPNARADAAAAIPMFTTRLHAKPVSGVGGMKNKGGGQKAKTGVKAKKNVPSKKGPKNKSVLKVGMNPESNIDWGKLIVAFLTPWRNPNSILLYLFIIVSILGKANENNVAQ